MGTLSLKAAIKVKRYRSYRGEVGQTAPNVLQRDFKATRPNEKWVTDVTEFAVNGRSLDNAVVECFFGTLKSECFYLDEFSNISELKDAVTEYIEYYNSRRISLKLKSLTPIAYRNQTYMPRV